MRKNKSILFDGIGDYLSVADEDDWEFFIEEFMIDIDKRTKSILKKEIKMNWDKYFKAMFNPKLLELADGCDGECSFTDIEEDKSTLKKGY